MSTNSGLERLGLLSSIWKRLKTHMDSREVLTFLFFFIFTSVVWFIHALNRNREVTLRFPLQYDNLSEQQAFLAPLPQQLMVKVRATGSNIMGYNDADGMPVIHIDAQHYSLGNRLYVSAEDLQQAVRAELHPNTTLLSITPDNIENQWQQLSSKTVPIMPDVDIRLDGQCIMTTEPRTTPAQITLYGAPEVLDTIKALRTTHYEVNALHDTLHTDIEILIPSTVRSDVRTVSLDACARAFTERKFSLPVTITNKPENVDVKIFPQSVTVIANVLQRDYNTANTSDIVLTVDYKTLENQRLANIEVHQQSNTWFNIRVSPKAVDFIIEK